MHFALDEATDESASNEKNATARVERKRSSANKVPKSAGTEIGTGKNDCACACVCAS